MFISYSYFVERIGMIMSIVQGFHLFVCFFPEAPFLQLFISFKKSRWIYMYMLSVVTLKIAPYLKLKVLNLLFMVMFTNFVFILHCLLNQKSQGYSFYQSCFYA